MAECSIAMRRRIRGNIISVQKPSEGDNATTTADDTTSTINNSAYNTDSASGQELYLILQTLSRASETLSITKKEFFVRAHLILLKYPAKNVVGRHV